MDRHAYLIMAHKEWTILEKLLRLLDFEGNDIYLHIDKKAADFPKEQMDRSVTKSKLFYFPSVNVNWGGYSQIACEMMMFQYMIEQVDEKYQYYHLLSGVDLPLKTQEEIHAFFDAYYGREFVTIGDYNPDESAYIYRAKYYFPFQEKIGAARAKGRNPIVYRSLAAIFLYLQKIFHVDRYKGRKVYMGANWIDITYDCMKYIVSKKDKVFQQYNMTVCADELFVQNILLESPFRECLYKQPIRFIDWKRGAPYIFRKEDYEELMDSRYLWARKFDSSIDGEIVDMIYQKLKN